MAIMHDGSANEKVISNNLLFCFLGNIKDATYCWANTFLFLGCSFVAIASDECPCSDDDDSGCNLADCSYGMRYDDLCEADLLLPDLSSKMDIDNCPGDYDIFKCVWGR